MTMGVTLETKCGEVSHFSYVLFPQSQTGEAPITKEPDSNTEDIHYGEINLSALEPKQARDTVGGSQEHQDTVYAHIKVSEPANTRTHTEDIYAQVKKSWMNDHQWYS